MTTSSPPSSPPPLGGTAADRVRALRTQRGLSQAALSYQAAVSLQTVSLLERTGFYTSVTAAKISRALGVPVAELFE